MPNLTDLITRLNPVRYYPLNDATEAGLIVQVTDESGNNAHLEPPAGVDIPSYELNSINSRPSIIFEDVQPLSNATALTARDIFILCKYDEAANFGAEFRGLLGDNSTGDLLTGETATTKFVSVGFGGGFSYYKSRTPYNEANQQAPFENFELVNIIRTTDFIEDGILLGQHRAFTDRRWLGRVAELIYFPFGLSTYERERVRLYFDLKFDLWRIQDYSLNFPSQEITGLPYNRFYRPPTDWKAVMSSHEYEDGGRSFNESADQAPIRWELRWTGLSQEETEVFDAFFDAVRYKYAFNFTDKFGTLHTGVRVEDYQRNHDEHKSWIQTVEFKLVKYPA